MIGMDRRFEAAAGDRQAAFDMSRDMSDIMARAHVMRAEMASEIIGAMLTRISGWFGSGRSPRTGDRALRRALAHLDARALHDLGLPADAGSEARVAALVDHPMAVGANRRVANENALAAARRAAVAAA